MDSAKIKFKHGILVGAVSFALALSACSGMSKKEEEAARLAQQEQMRLQEETRRKQEEARKLAEKKQELEAEDKLEVTAPRQIEKPVIEKLSEPVSATESSGASDMTLHAATMPSLQKLDIPVEPNTYLITVDEKNKTHPLFGVGSKMGFAVNGVQGHYIIAKRGETVTFKVRTGVQHDFYLTTSPMGWGAAAYMDGVEGQFTYEGDVTFTPDASTPDVIYFGCRNHNSMGSKVVVVDTNADINAVKAALDKERQEELARNESKAADEATPQKIQQKISYVEMMLQFKGGDMDADHKAQIVTMLYLAKNHESAGELEDAYAAAQSAVALFNYKPAAQGPSKEEIAEFQDEFNGLLITLEAFIDSHKASYDQVMKTNPSGAVDYDHDLVGSLIIEGKKLAEENKFKQAKNRVQRAENLVNTALNSMLGSQTLVYELKFETPEDEYNYEVDVYQSYLDLVPIAIETKKPAQASITLSETYLNKGKFFKEKSEESADAERWDEALVVIKDATMEVRRALTVLGVSM